MPGQLAAFCRLPVSAPKDAVFPLLVSTSATGSRRASHSSALGLRSIAQIESLVRHGCSRYDIHDRLHVTILAHMAATSKPKPSRVKVREHRERLRSQGLRPIQIWVPDVRAPSFRSEAHRQSLAVAASAHAREDQAFIDAVSDWEKK